MKPEVRRFARKIAREAPPQFRFFTQKGTIPMKTLWGYISAAAFLAVALMIGFFTLHVIFFYIIPIILALIAGFWVMRMIGDLLCRK